MSSTTGYARLTPSQARVVLAVVGLALGLGVAVTLSPMASSNLKSRPNEASDVALYRAEVDRIRGGEGYYRVAAAELTARGYPTRSVFNWRTPLPMWLLGKMPAVVLGKALLGSLALALMLLAFEAMTRDQNAAATVNPELPPPVVEAERMVCGPGDLFRRHGRAIACVLLLTGPLLPTVLGDLFVLPVLWAGVLIAISVCAYGVNRPLLGTVFGLMAVFFRELALPYCVLCAGIAWWNGRRGELAAWTLGLTAWLLLFGLHAWQVSGLIAPDAHAHRQGWLQFGGAGFVISTAQMNAYLLLLPQWVTAVYLVAAMVGFAGWNTPLGMRTGLAACLFLTAFAMVGQSFNQYWGSLMAPLLCFGVVRFPASIRDLYRAATAPSEKGALHPRHGFLPKRR